MACADTSIPPTISYGMERKINSTKIFRVRMDNFRSIAAILLVLCANAGYAQLTKHKTPDRNWELYGQVKYAGPAKASLHYMVNNNDSSFLLMMWDQRPELKKYFSITFSSHDNTLHQFYDILMSCFVKGAEKGTGGIQRFQLGNENVSVYRSATIGTAAIIISTDKGRIELRKGEIERLFKK